MLRAAAVQHGLPARDRTAAAPHRGGLRRPRVRRHPLRLLRRDAARALPAHRPEGGAGRARHGAHGRGRGSRAAGVRAHRVPRRRAQDLDRVDSVVTGCALAVAETGTIVLDGAPDQGRRRITLIPDHHVCVIRVPEQAVDSVPQALDRLDPARTLTWISGPSATSDIELDRVEGVHGPRTLEVVLLAAQ
ncbi:lactate utilization protein C [Streptomyces sp. NPDC090021]|uniref:LutC/YkgG family protein n=1 Tax=Streptomyces sp. NPDC090021 TaxID=3365919 RepID=UPI0037FE9DFA